MILRCCAFPPLLGGPLANGSRRFLRARRFVVTEAWAQFKSTEDWRKETQIDQLYETIDLDHYEETRRLVSEFPPIPSLPCWQKLTGTSIPNGQDDGTVAESRSISSR